MPEAVPLAVDEPLVAPVAPAAPEAPAPAEGGAPAAQNIEDQAPPAAPEGDKPEEVTPELAAKREGRRFEKKLDRAFRRAAEADARAELLQRQLDEARQAAAPKQPVLGQPRLEDFEFDPEKYATALADFKMRQGFQRFQVHQQQQFAQQHAKVLTDAWSEKAAKGESKYEDFDEVVGDIKPTHPMMRAVMLAENGEDIAYYLGKDDKKEGRRIIALDPESMLIEIGRISAKLLAEPPKPKTPSKAPAPITPVGGTSGGSSDIPADSDDIATWMKKENARMKKQAGA